MRVSSRCKGKGARPTPYIYRSTRSRGSMQSHGGMRLELGRDGQGGSACPRRDGEVTFTHERWLVVSFPLFLQPLSARIIRTWGEFRDEPLQLFRYRGSLDRDRHLAPIRTHRAHHARVMHAPFRRPMFACLNVLFSLRYLRLPDLSMPSQFLRITTNFFPIPTAPQVLTSPP